MTRLSIRWLHQCSLAALLALPGPPVLADDTGLATLMSRMQTHTHKLQLSIEARNAPLADFYLHELEEAAEEVVAGISHYRDYPVGQLTREMLLPMIEQLEETVETGDWAISELRFLDLLRACNACHLVTEHGFIRMAPASGNPFAQDFAPIED